MTTAVDNAYLAGFIDGEGSITLSLAKGYPRTGFKISNTRRGVIDWIHANYGGSIYTCKRLSEPQKKECFIIQFNIGDSRDVLQRVIPYMKVKKEQAEILLAYSKLPRFNKPEVYMAMIERMTELNRMGSGRPHLVT
jgi:hypothetical protein